MTNFDGVRTGVDRALEASVAGSFTRIGPAVRSRLFGWEPLAAHRIDGKISVVTGATSGLGLATATELARLGSRVVLLVRDTERGRAVGREITAATGSNDVTVVEADMGDIGSVRRAAESLRRLPGIDVLIHNAGALSRTRQVSPQGIEQTVAAQLIGPFLLTHLVGAQLRNRPSRVIFVTSGGMYTEPLHVDALEMSADVYDGVTAYARVKRAQVSLVERWAPQLNRLAITIAAMHPGWADTPGVRTSLPTFGRVVGPLLRTPSEGADTIVWLASAPGAGTPPGSLWLDRRQRSPHRLGRTRRSDTAAERARLWTFCCERSGITGDELAALS
ncbi:MAG: SDR family NAD(P)-dependent oxidoreductase [Candidatus Dormiibacterota bacterium]